MRDREKYKTGGKNGKFKVRNMNIKIKNINLKI
jgi:hypothetical protein